MNLSPTLGSVSSSTSPHLEQRLVERLGSIPGSSDIFLGVPAGTRTEVDELLGMIDCCSDPLGQVWRGTKVSHLATTNIKPLPASFIIPAIFWSSCTLDSPASINSRHILACSMALKLRRTLKCSTPLSILPLRRIPAVSNSSMFLFLYFMFALLISLVVPAFDATTACCFLASVLNNLYFPTFVRPSSAIRNLFSGSPLTTLEIWVTKSSNSSAKPVLCTALVKTIGFMPSFLNS